MSDDPILAETHAQIDADLGTESLGATVDLRREELGMMRHDTLVPEDEAAGVPPISALESHATMAESFLRSIANRHRLMVLCSLLDGEISAGELRRRIGLTQSNASRHLATLREEGLVASRREATTIYYRIASDRVQTILVTLHGMFCSADSVRPLIKTGIRARHEVTRPDAGPPERNR
jgi:DNA-binding transcriptional ArsR family regulator